MTKKKIHQRLCTLALLAMALSFFSNITPLWLKQADGTPILICSTLGTKTIVIDKNGKEVPPPIRITNKCPLCLNLSDDNIDLAILENNSTHVKALELSVSNLFLARQAPLKPTRNTPSARPRAPPTHLL